MFQFPLRKAAVIDRDGFANYLVDRGPDFRLSTGKPCRWTAPFRLEELRLYPEAQAALELMKQKGYMLILATNQPDVATGNMRLEEYEKIMEVVRKLPFDGIYVCRHHPKAGCLCRKPAPGLIYAAAHKHGIDRKLSYMMGDMETDIEAGKAAGLRTILATVSDDVPTSADHRVRGIMEAAILLP